MHNRRHTWVQENHAAPEVLLAIKDENDVIVSCRIRFQASTWDLSTFLSRHFVTRLPMEAFHFLRIKPSEESKHVSDAERMG